MLSSRCTVSLDLAVGLIIACLALSICQSQTGAIELEKHSRVRPTQDRKHLFVLDSQRLRLVGPKGQNNVVTYSPHLDFELPLSFASGETRKFLATADRVLEVSANPPKEAIHATINPWADSPIAVYGRNQDLAYIAAAGTVFTKVETVKVQAVKGVYSSSDSDYLYLATENALVAYDTSTDKETGRLVVNNPKNLAIVNRGRDVLFAHDTNKLSLYDRRLSRSSCGLSFNEGQSIWAVDLHDERLAVVTWEGAALSAEWVARFYDLKTKKELKKIGFKHPVACFILEGNSVAIVSEQGITWEPW